jgi:hypothetical protein
MNKVTCYDLEWDKVAIQFWEDTKMPDNAIIWFWIEVSDHILEILQWENREAQVRKILNNIADEWITKSVNNTK